MCNRAPPSRPSNAGQLAVAMRHVLSLTRRVVMLGAMYAAATSIAWAQTDEPELLGYSVDELVDLYVVLALSDEFGIGTGHLVKWHADSSVRILPQPSATLIGRYGIDYLVDETKRIADTLASRVSRPKIVSFDMPALEEFLWTAQGDTSGAPFANSLLVVISERAELIEQMRQLERESPGAAPPFFIPYAQVQPEIVCIGLLTRTKKGAPYRGILFIEYSERLSECLYEEIMQAFGILNDFPEGTPSLFNDDNVYSEPTELDWLLWRVHGDTRLEAGMSEAEVRPAAREIIKELLAEK